MYEPQLARFTSRDPLLEGDAELLGPFPDMKQESQSQQSHEHPYAYAADNPINRIDPSGLIPLTEREKRIICDWAGTQPHIRNNPITGEPSTGGVICFAGEKISCSWQEPVGDKELDDILHKCLIAHEDTHHDDTPECCPGRFYRPPWKKGVDRKKEECEAYLEQRTCYELALWLEECRTDFCRDIVRGLIAAMNKELNDRGCDL